jgi:hypothetical protein
MPKPATITETTTGPTMSLPTTTPAEALNISPEALTVANCYLQNPDLYQVAQELQISPEVVGDILARREVKAYVDQVFYSLGFNNRFKMGDLMDSIIRKKLQDMDEAEVGSTKDISELLALKHKMLMEHMDREIKLESLKASNVKTQTNIQINESAGGSRYSQLIERLMSDGQSNSKGAIDV